MPKQSAPRPSNESMIYLSRLLLPPRNNDNALSLGIANISRNEFDDLLNLASTNHVVIRWLEVFFRLTCDARDGMRSEWAATALANERVRIKNAVSFLHEICGVFEQAGLDITVIKSLDHWPDLGSDLDLYTSAHPELVSQLMKKRFRAEIAPRSWGDRLACKWNFLIPGLREAVEIHMGRLGQTGEQVRIASRLPGRARTIQIEGLTFRVPAVSDRIMISTLQRMYRHFYFRLCDIIDSAGLVENCAIDYDDLRTSAMIADIWEGVATYLAIVSDYVKRYRGASLDLPTSVTTTARFGGAEVYFARDFLRVPIMPQSASLYRSQLTGLLRKREINNSARLGLLPWLATAAVVGQKLTGSDKGIW
jgi:hypothetical protein